MIAYDINEFISMLLHGVTKYTIAVQKFSPNCGFNQQRLHLDANFYQMSVGKNISLEVC